MDGLTPPARAPATPLVTWGTTARVAGVEAARAVAASLTPYRPSRWSANPPCAVACALKAWPSRWGGTATLRCGLVAVRAGRERHLLPLLQAWVVVAATNTFLPLSGLWVIPSPSHPLRPPRVVWSCRRGRLARTEGDGAATGGGVVRPWLLGRPRVLPRWVAAAAVMALPVAVAVAVATRRLPCWLSRLVGAAATASPAAPGFGRGYHSRWLAAAAAAADAAATVAAAAAAFVGYAAILADGGRGSRCVPSRWAPFPW